MKSLRVGHGSIYTHEKIFSKMLMEQIESYQQYYVYNFIHINLCFEIEKGEINMPQKTQHAARKTQIDRQVEKRTYTHDIDS